MTHRFKPYCMPYLLPVGAGLIAPADRLQRARREETLLPRQGRVTVTLTRCRPSSCRSRSARTQANAPGRKPASAPKQRPALAEVRANVGDVGKRGQVLAVFAADTVQADLAQVRASVAEAEATLAEASVNAQRARDLQPSGALSAQQISQYLTLERTAQARVQAARAGARVQQLRLAQTQVVAPDNGVISSRSATVGAVLPAGQELFRLIRRRLEARGSAAATSPRESACGHVAPSRRETLGRQCAWLAHGRPQTRTARLRRLGATRREAGCTRA